MGIYFNPDSQAFQRRLRNRIFVDKSRLIGYTNDRLLSDDGYICVSRPRRFGKSTTLDMLAAYYSREGNAGEIFNNLKISESDSYRENLNKYNVIYIDMQRFLNSSENDIDRMIGLISEIIISEIKQCTNNCSIDETRLSDFLEKYYYNEKIPFVFLIDEWDCVFRVIRGDEEKKKVYLNFLRDLFKGRTYVALAYMTGILPIKQYGQHSILNMFYEYSMLHSFAMSSYVGFTAEEVQTLCRHYGADFGEMKEWYDGYRLDGTELYCPKSVVCALENEKYINYWARTEYYAALEQYITMNIKGLKDIVVSLLAGNREYVNPDKFSNDMFEIRSKDDVLTLLIHLGYLGYLDETSEVMIPNKEIAKEFVSSIEDNDDFSEINAAIIASRKLLGYTLKKQSDRVAAQLEEVHRKNSALLHYNNEQALRTVILLAYYYAREQYMLIQEMPSGEGFADIMFIPKYGTDPKMYPPMIIELKWDDSPDTAIRQIRSKKYYEQLKEYDRVLLVGISYDKKQKSITVKLKSIGCKDGMLSNIKVNNDKKGYII